MMETNPVDTPKKRKTGTILTGSGRKTRSFHDMRLRSRLMLLVLAISVPVIALVIAIPTFYTEPFLRSVVNEQLQRTNTAVFLKADQWLEMNENALNQLASLDDIISMDPARQKPVVLRASKVYSGTINTTNLKGFNVVRSDGQPNQSLGDRPWFKGVILGWPVTYQVLVSRATDETSLNMSVPVKDSTGKMVGVISMLSNLDRISRVILPMKDDPLSKGTITFIVDQTNNVIAHPDANVASKLTSYSKYQPVYALRDGKTGHYEFVDDQGKSWFAYITLMDNGWGIITQQETAVALAPVYQLRVIAWSVLAAGIFFMIVSVYMMVRMSLRPIDELTATASAIAEGDLNQVAVVRRNDEVGMLAHSFNIMTAQLRENITNLEQRVSDRTRALELSTEVSHHLSTILNLDQLSREVVNELQRAFNYYHVQIYLFDETRENLVTAGGTGDVGQLLLASGHRLPAKKGLVGRAADQNEAVLVWNTTQDPDWLPNPLLPDTKSELAVPIALGDQVQGVLDVQQNQVGGLTQLDVDLIKAIANQVAIALRNAKTYTQVQQRAEREALVAALGQKIQQAATIDEVLQVAVSGLGQALNAQRSSVELRVRDLSANKKN